jgi:serine/threonine protein kinase
VKIGTYGITGGVWQVVSSDAKSLIKKMLTFKFTDRVTAREALNDPWFTNASSVMVDSEIMKECMQNLSRFSATQKLQQATMSMMV